MEAIDYNTQPYINYEKSSALWRYILTNNPNLDIKPDALKEVVQAFDKNSSVWKAFGSVDPLQKYPVAVLYERIIYKTKIPHLVPWVKANIVDNPVVAKLSLNLQEVLITYCLVTGAHPKSILIGLNPIKYYVIIVIAIVTIMTLLFQLDLNSGWSWAVILWTAASAGLAAWIIH